MSRSWMICAAAVLCAASFMVGKVVAQDEGGAGMQMPEWMNPTKEHEGLKKNVGEWDAACKFTMAPGQPMQEFEGKAEAELVLGGKFLTQMFKGEMMGMPFQGHMLMGFDTLAKEYVSIWVDSWTPYVYYYRGTEKEGVIHLAGQEPDPATGEIIKTRHEVKWTDDNTYVVKFFKPGPDGKEFLSGEITYSRAQ